MLNKILKKGKLLLLFVSYTFCACSYGKTTKEINGLPLSTDTIAYTILGQLKNNQILIKDTIDLDNNSCIIPKGLTLVFNGGYIKNGTLVGNMTRLKSIKACFNRVRILGSWNVPIINSNLFDDLTYENALKDVVALSDSMVSNKIVIANGKYKVSAQKNCDICISVNSNTELIINGEIELTPNDYRNYYIIQASGNNIKIRGKGTIKGDKHTHLGNSGEWGMGVNLDNAHNTVISGLEIKDCWGDCIYVGNGSTDVTIKNCRLDNGRRQGISITSANKVNIQNCKITNVGGTSPEYAIDVEPNKGDSVDNILIDNVTVEKCIGGFLVYGKAPEARVGEVSIRNCTLTNVPKMPIKLQRCESAIVEKCKIIGCKRKDPIMQEEVRRSSVMRNHIDL